MCLDGEVPSKSQGSGKNMELHFEKKKLCQNSIFMYGNVTKIEYSGFAGPSQPCNPQLPLQSNPKLELNFNFCDKLNIGASSSKRRAKCVAAAPQNQRHARVDPRVQHAATIVRNELSVHFKMVTKGFTKIAGVFSCFFDFKSCKCLGLARLAQFSQA